MAARGIFIGLTLAQVTAIQTAAVASLTAGAVNMSTSVDGVSFSKQFAMPVADVMEECAYAIAYLTTGAGVRRRVHPGFNRAYTNYGTVSSVD